jgi:hypothetical protein
MNDMRGGGICIVSTDCSGLQWVRWEPWAARGATLGAGGQVSRIGQSVPFPLLSASPLQAKGRAMQPGFLSRGQER